MLLREREPHRAELFRIVRVVVVDPRAVPLEPALHAAEALHCALRLGAVASERDGHPDGERGVLAVEVLRTVHFAARVDDRSGAVLHERVEHLVHLLLRVVVRRGVGDDRRVRAERHERLVALVDFCDGVCALSEADSAFPSRNVRPVDAHRVESAAGEDVSEHRCYGGLPARANHRYEPVGRKRAGEGLCAVGHGDAERLRLREAGVRVLDGGTHHHGGQARDNARTVLRKTLDATFFKLSHHKRLFCRTELTVRPANRNTFANQILGNGTHAHARNTDKKVRFHNK